MLTNFNYIKNVLNTLDEDAESMKSDEDASDEIFSSDSLSMSEDEDSNKKLPTSTVCGVCL